MPRAARQVGPRLQHIVATSTLIGWLRIYVWWAKQSPAMELTRGRINLFAWLLQLMSPVSLSRTDYSPHSRHTTSGPKARATNHADGSR